MLFLYYPIPSYSSYMYNNETYFIFRFHDQPFHRSYIGALILNRYSVCSSVVLQAVHRAKSWVNITKLMASHAPKINRAGRRFWSRLPILTNREMRKSAYVQARVLKHFLHAFMATTMCPQIYWTLLIIFSYGNQKDVFTFRGVHFFVASSPQKYRQFITSRCRLPLSEAVAPADTVTTADIQVYRKKNPNVFMKYQMNSVKGGGK